MNPEESTATSTSQRRALRKEEGKRLKRKRIEEAGGVRPRSTWTFDAGDGSIVSGSKNSNDTESFGRTRQQQTKNNNSKDRNDKGGGQTKQQQQQKHHHHSKQQQQRQRQHKHRFGGVMENSPCPNRPRYHTVSIAIPGSVISNRQTRELRTNLVGQIARAATIYHVDEIVVYDDKLSVRRLGDNTGTDRRRSRSRRGGEYDRHCNRDGKNDQHDGNTEKEDVDDEGVNRSNDADEDAKHGSAMSSSSSSSDPHTFMARVLQYCECPQYLRRHFFPMHPDLQFAGLLSPVDAPHHVRAGDKCSYREGVVLDKRRGRGGGGGGGSKKGSNANDGAGGSLVNCGIPGRPVEIDRVLTPGIRCTVQLNPKSYDMPGKIITGKVVSPAAPREDNGTYWGYTTRLADSIKAVFDECPHEGGYDLKIGTSERGDVTVDDKGFGIPLFRHLIIVFGGVAGIEECIDADESLALPGSESRKLFDLWVNTCPFQGSRTIRTEEAVLISLARLRPYVANNKEGGDGYKAAAEVGNISSRADAVEFSDDSPSEESSEGES